MIVANDTQHMISYLCSTVTTALSPFSRCKFLRSRPFKPHMVITGLHWSAGSTFTMGYPWVTICLKRLAIAQGAQDRDMVRQTDKLQHHLMSLHLYWRSHNNVRQKLVYAGHLRGSSGSKGYRWTALWNAAYDKCYDQSHFCHISWNVIIIVFNI